MGKKPNRQRWANKAAAIKKSKKSEVELFEGDISDDEIDAFHSRSEKIPLDVEDAEESDDDAEEAIFDLEGIDDSDNADTDNDAPNISNGGSDCDRYDRKLLAKMERQLKQIRSAQDYDDGILDEETDDDEEKSKAAWGQRKTNYYGGEKNFDVQSGDEDLLKEEEKDVIRLQKKKVQAFSMEDFGLEDLNDKNYKNTSKIMDIDSAGTLESYEEHEMFLSLFCGDKQVDPVFSSAPEMVGLLSELNWARAQLEDTRATTQVKHFLEKEKGRMSHSDVKRALLLAYCQVITFYILMKAEGLSTQYHPVIAYLIELKNLVDELKHMDFNEHSLEDDETNGLRSNYDAARADDIGFLSTEIPSDGDKPVSELGDFKTSNPQQNSLHNITELMAGETLDSSKLDNKLGVHSKEMFKVRASLETKLKEKGLYQFTQLKPETIPTIKPTKKGLVDLDDFDDEVPGVASDVQNIKKLMPAKPSKKFSSGDADIPKRDPIGERRRKFELRVLARAGGADGAQKHLSHEDVQTQTHSKSSDQNADGDGVEVSEDEFYEAAKRRRTEEQKAKEQIYSLKPAPSFEEDKTEGKRQITYQIEKNRGLTRPRKKIAKIPRKKYKMKHEKKVTNRKGQVRDVRRPSGPYGGEATGINKDVSRSIRLR